MAAMRVCKQADIPAKRIMSGQDACRPGRPARISIDKFKLHYVNHYMYRGIWDELVPEEKEEELGKIEAYWCNMCSRRFRNNHDKKSYPGRGSMVCHLATEHGQLLKAMRADDKVDMSEEIEALNEHEKGQFIEMGIPDVPDKELYTARESFMWKIQNGKTNLDGGNNNNTPSRTSNDAPKIVPFSRTELADKNLMPQNDGGRQRPKVHECPHCNDCKNNMDPSRLRLHIFHHYKDRWEHRLDKLEKGPNYFYCDMCPKRKQLKGANELGARTSAICHYAIQHHELRDVLKRDDNLPADFVENLYYDIDLKEGKLDENGKLKVEEPKIVPSSKPVESKKPEPPKKAAKAPEPARGHRSKSAKKEKDAWLSSDDDDKEEEEEWTSKAKGKKTATKAPAAKKKKN